MRQISISWLSAAAFAGSMILATVSAPLALAQSTEYIIFQVTGSADGLIEKFVLGSVLKDGDKIEIPEEAELRLLDKAGKVVVLTGPLTGTIENSDGSSKEAEDGSNALQVIAKLMFGEDKLVNNLGAARALQSVSTKEGEDRAWVPVISIPGTYCLSKHDPVFGRAVAIKKAKITLLSGSELLKEKIWETDEKSISIGDMIIEGTDTYTMFHSSHTAESSIHLLDRTTMNTTGQIAWMAERGCTAQARQLLDEASNGAS